MITHLYLLGGAKTLLVKNKKVPKKVINIFIKKFFSHFFDFDPY